jgi:uncharacterized DUF497 family protein
MYEWDSEKEALNIKKHGLDFDTAVLVFEDENYIEWYDSQHSETEERYNVLGMVHDVLFVVYTERRDNVRIISARLATKQERSLYYMIVTKKRVPGAKPTPEQIAMIEAAKKMPITYDEDSPALTPEAIEGFRLAARERNRRRREQGSA